MPIHFWYRDAQREPRLRKAVEKSMDLNLPGTAIIANVFTGYWRAYGWGGGGNLNKFKTGKGKEPKPTWVNGNTRYFGVKLTFFSPKAPETPAYILGADDYTLAALLSVVENAPPSQRDHIEALIEQIEVQKERQ